jgi:hypothetical protein
MRGLHRCGVFSTYSSVQSGFASLFGVAKGLVERFGGVVGRWSFDFRLREACGGDLPISVARRFSYSLYLAAMLGQLRLVALLTYQCRSLQRCPSEWVSGHGRGSALFPKT